MINARQKGSRIQAKLVKLLEASEYYVAVVERKGKFIKVKDMYGLFDLLAINESGDVLFVQVTCNRPHTHYLYQNFAKKFCRVKVEIRQYVHYDRKGFRMYKYNEHGYDKYDLW